VFVVQNYPNANFVLADAITGEVKNKFCMPAVVQFTSTSTISPSNTPIALNWNGLGNSQPIVPSSVVATQYTNNAVYTISLSVSTIPSQCTSTKVYTIAVFRPTAGMTISQSTICLGQPLEMKILDRNGVEWWVWDYGVNSAQSNTILSVLQPTNPSHFYSYTSFPANPSGTVTLRMFYIDPAGACPAYKDTVIKLLKIDADFKRNNELAKADTIHCLGIPDKFTFNSASNSPSTLAYNWTYANAQSSNSSVLNYTALTAGIYTVAINVSDPQFGCTATKVKKIIINPLPSAYLSVQDTSCPQVPFVLNGGGAPGVSGGLTATLNPGGITNFSMSTQNTFSLNTSALVSTTYSLLVTDENGCVSPAATDYIFVQQAAPQINWDTTVVIGQTVQLNANVGSNYTYTWTPVIDHLNCVNCFNPVTTTTVDITYSVTLEDHPLSCFKSVNTYKVKINLITTVDVPTAFTPNEDGTNDFIFPDGWGIKKLNYFKVYNRWGQLLFETNELKHGWDGKFNGVPQNMETYVYQVSAESYTKETYTKSGTFKLIR
ncbi:MAG: gliding motility-associated C-terminal domain-containing protein, partial [Bacteroidia bacterium]|nr:gliding motility-associated C-terminal domain-containing protein [Bacteroidia bacterium]